MLTAVDLHNHLHIGTEEVDDVTIDWHLPLELPTIKSPPTQAQPQHALCVRLMPPQASRQFGVMCHRAQADYANPAPLTPILSPAGSGSSPRPWKAMGSRTPTDSGA